MNDFKSFGIKPVKKGLEGDKINIKWVFGKQVLIQDYRIVPSKFQDKGNGKCLHLQIKMGESINIIFTSSAVLMEQIEQVPKDKFPFRTTIIKENERFEFS
jgi:hypothetical protein